MSNGTIIHATVAAVAVDPDGPLLGLAIIGPSNSGKSSLALSLLLGCPFGRTALVADDVALVKPSDNALIAHAPARLKGLIEIRGFGPARVKSVPLVELALVLDLTDGPERMPEIGAFCPIAGCRSTPLIPFRWEGHEAIAPVRARQLLCAILDGQSAQPAQDGGAKRSAEGE
jgi:hypothetical protein